MTVVSAITAGLALALLLPSPPALRVSVPRAASSASPVLALVLVLALGGATTGALGPSAAPVALGAMVAVVFVVRRAESGTRRRQDAAVAADLPHVVGLLGDALRAGQAPAGALRQVMSALPGAAADQLAPIVAQLDLGMDPGGAWAVLDGTALAALGRTMARTHDTGASVVGAIEGLAMSLADARRQEAESKARTVGVRAAIPLGLCLLPSFVLLGIVPVVAGLLTDLTG